jgi:hypothetical protein
MTDAPRDRELVEVIAEPLAAGCRWRPTVGEEALALIDRLKLAPEDGHRALEEAARILARCAPPAQPPETATGLVIGYVQSGKTRSFTLVSALARDNGFRIVIVITGTSIPLLRQSGDRLLRDLDVSRSRSWREYQNPRARGGDVRSMQATLQRWIDPLVGSSERPCVLITVMKHHAHLQKLNAVLAALGDLSGAPTLVIDDEADQASLNTQVNQNTESATYRCLTQLRAQLPSHTYLQYTATPQAPLLINVIDALSPDFAEILVPGDDYLGGREVFLIPPQLTRVIPPQDVGTAASPLVDPPESLLFAMRVFLVGVASHLAGRSDGEDNRSMMVHPSRETAGHDDYRNWVDQTLATWKRTIRLPDGDPDRLDLLEEFRIAYADLATSADDMASFDTLVSRLPSALEEVLVTEVNTRAGPTPQVKWKRDPYHILVGGQALDRGFTVEGLTVTYMPRSLGQGTADTVQQRARFFGYKRTYRGLCRVFLCADVLRAFNAYVEHEDDVRARLIVHRDSGRPLVDWKRAFFLDTALSPTRSCVLDLDYVQGNFREEWVRTRAPHTSVAAFTRNRELVERFLARIALTEDDGSPQRTEMQRHDVGIVPLSLVYEELLTKFRHAYGFDSQQFTGMALQLRRYLDDHPDTQCTIYHMSKGRLRDRKTENEELVNLMQGPHPDRTGAIYPGDHKIRAREGVTIQIHRLNIRGTALADVPALVVWIPAEMARGWLSQPQGG